MTNSSENVFHTCRSCLLLSNDTYQIFETMIEEDLSVVTLLNYFLFEVQEDDLPQQICHSCLLKLKAAYEFFEMFKKSQAILQQRFTENQGEHIMILNGNPKLNVVFENNINAPSIIKQTSTDTKMDRIDVEESIIIKYGESDKESHDSDDEDYLIAKSVKLTEMYKRGQLDNSTDNDSDGNEKETEDEVDVTTKKFSNSNIFSDVQTEPLEESTVKTLICKMCSEDFTDVNLYMQHQCEGFFCVVCNKSLPSTDAYKKHMQGHSKPSPSRRLSCPKKNCSKTFSGKQSLRSHYLTIHSEKRNYLCSLCGSSFKNYDNLRYHIKKHKGPSHVCTYCGKAFILSAHLKDHTWRHLGAKPHKCTTCDKGFVTKKLLARHIENNCGKVNST